MKRFSAQDGASATISVKPENAEKAVLVLKAEHEAAARALLPNAAPRRSNAWVRVANDPSAYEHPLLVGDRHGTLEATHRQTAKEEMSRGDESGAARL